MITGIAHLCLAVKDLDAMESFYVTKLGLHTAFEFKNEVGHRHGLYLQVGNRTFIELFEGRTQNTTLNPSYRHVCLEVDDLNATLTELRARGVETTNPKLGGDHAWQAWVHDPEGNAIELHCYTPASLQTPHL